MGSLLCTLAHAFLTRSIESACQRVSSTCLYFSKALWVVLIGSQALGIFATSAFAQMMPPRLVLPNQGVSVIEIWSGLLTLSSCSFSHHLITYVLSSCYVPDTECVIQWRANTESLERESLVGKTHSSNDHKTMFNRMLIGTFHQLAVSIEDSEHRLMGNQCPHIHLRLAKNQLVLILAIVHFYPYKRK